MKRRLKLILLISFSVLVAGVGTFALRLRSKMKGPPPPVCALPELVRHRFDRPIQISRPDSEGARIYDIEPMAALTSSGALAIVYNTRDHIWEGTSGLSTALVDLDGHVTVKAYPTDRAEAFDAWMAAGPDGKTRMVWLAHDGGTPERNMKIGYAETTDGLHWSSPLSANPDSDCPNNVRGCLDKPMIATSKDCVYVAYFADQSEVLRVTTSALDRPRFESSTAACCDAYGDLDVTPSGQLWIVSTRDPEEKDVPPPDRFGDSRRTITIVRSDDRGKTFSVPIIVSAQEPIPFYFVNPQVRVDEARGFVYVVYPAGGQDTAWKIMLATSHDAGKTWTRVQVNDDPPCANHMTPRAALDPETGMLHLTWLENRSGTGVLAYSACEPGGARCSSNEAVSDEPFASYSYERHLAAWLSEYGALVVDARRGILHAVWTQPVVEHGSPVSRIFYARARLR